MMAAAAEEEEEEAAWEGVRGTALMFAAMAAANTAAGGTSGYVGALWCVGALSAARLSRPGRRAATALACTAPAVLLTGQLTFSLVLFLGEKVALAGSQPRPLGLLLGDALMGAVYGAMVGLTALGLVLTLELAPCDLSRTIWSFGVVVRWVPAVQPSSATGFDAMTPRQHSAADGRPDMLLRLLWCE